MSFVDERTTRLGFWTTLLGCLFALAPATYPGYWQGLEGFVPVFNAIEPDNIAAVATLPDLWRGTGGAAFLLVYPLLVLGLTPTAAVRAVFIFAILLGGLGCYAWLRPRLGDRAAGLAGLVYTLLPPLLATVYIRGSLSDALILGLLPLALAGTASYAEGRSPSAAGVVVLCLLWMWRIQAGLALLATLLLLLYAGLVERSRLALLVVGVTGMAGLVSLIPLWNIHAAPPVAFADHFLYAAQLLYGGWQVAPSIPGWQDAYPFQLGFAALAFSLVTLWLWRYRVVGWRGTVTARLLRFSFIGALVLLLLTLNLSAPLWAWTRADRLLTYPWQIMLLACPLLAVTAGSLAALNPHLQRAPVWLALAALALLGSYPYLLPNFTQVTPPALPVATFGPRPDLVLLEAQITQYPSTNTAQLDITWQPLQPLTDDYNVFFQAVTGSRDNIQVVGQTDVQPQQGELPATQWQVGTIYTDTYQLTLTDSNLAQLMADDPANGPTNVGDTGLRYFFGYYDWRDGTRLPVNGGIDDKVVLHAQ